MDIKKIQILLCLGSSQVTYFSSSYHIQLTCTDNSISSIARAAGAGETPLCVITLCILMTVVFIPPTFINICMEGTEYEKV